jgi:peptide/nickel transport system ATP-binding protein
MSTSPAAAPLLTVSHLSIGYQTPSGTVQAVDDASFTLDRGEILGIVGESGSGKSTLVKGLLRWLGPPAVVLGGHVELDGKPILALEEEALRQTRWSSASLVPQSALNAFNPVLTVGEQIVDTLQAHRPLSAPAALEEARRLLELVDLDPRHVHSYPHQLSGGMRQRVALGLALALSPPLVVMDEPTTALDVVVERQILRRLLELQQARGFAVVFITHDIALLLEFATRLAVMYAGRMVEVGPVGAFRAGGTHPYTRGLLAALPPAIDEDREPISIPGNAPRVADPPPGCRFHPRCALAEPRCRAEAPPLALRAPDHQVACWVAS